MSKSGHKLLDERPLFVLPSLAVQLGLFGSIFIQQLHHNLVWLAESIERESKEEERQARGKKTLWMAKGDYQRRLWYRATPTALLEEFPWSSNRTIKRTISACRPFGLLTTSRGGYDQTNYYSLDYDQLRKIGIFGEGQIDPIQRAILALSIGPPCPDPKGQSGAGILPDQQTKSDQQPPISGGGCKSGKEEKINWPENLAGYVAGLKPMLADLDDVNRQAFVDEISEKLREGRIKGTPSAYAAGMLKKGWQPGEAATAERQAAEIEERVTAILAAAEAGQTILLDGELAQLDGRYLRPDSGGCVPLQEAVARGWVEINEIAAANKKEVQNFYG